MKRFARHKTHDEIKRQCAEQGVPFNDHGWRKRGDDHIVIGLPSRGHVLYNTFNGRFFGRTPGMPQVPEWPVATDFDSDDTKLDGQPWFDALLLFFYTDR
jgi:hypothetical protein